MSNFEKKVLELIHSSISQKIIFGNWIDKTYKQYHDIFYNIQLYNSETACVRLVISEKIWEFMLSGDILMVGGGAFGPVIYSGKFEEEWLDKSLEIIKMNAILDK